MSRWERELEARRLRVKDHGVEALKWLGLTAAGFGGLVIAAHKDADEPSQLNSEMGATGAFTAAVAFFLLVRELVRLSRALFGVMAMKRGRRPPRSR